MATLKPLFKGFEFEGFALLALQKDQNSKLNIAIIEDFLSGVFNSQSRGEQRPLMEVYKMVEDFNDAQQNERVRECIVKFLKEHFSQRLKECEE